MQPRSGARADDQVRQAFGTGDDLPRGARLDQDVPAVLERDFLAIHDEHAGAFQRRVDLLLATLSLVVLLARLIRLVVELVHPNRSRLEARRNEFSPSLDRRDVEHPVAHQAGTTTSARSPPLDWRSSVPRSSSRTSARTIDSPVPAASSA